MGKKIYVTITGTVHYLGDAFLKEGTHVTLIKDPDNKYDHEAIRVEMKGLGKIGWKCQVLCSLKTHKNQFGIGTEQLDRYLSSFCAVREGRKFSRRGLCRAGSVVA